MSDTTIVPPAAPETTPTPEPSDAPPTAPPVQEEAAQEPSLASASAKAPAAEGEKAPEGPPVTVESYKDLKFPDGYTVDNEALEAFKARAATAKISPTDAQNFVDMYISGQQSIMQEVSNQMRAKVAAWRQESESMPAFQGEQRAKSLETLGKLMDEYGSPEARAILDESGLGNHPAIVNYLLKVGAQLVEGEPAPPGEPPKRQDGARTAGDIFYSGPPVRVNG